jgi:hypothetical protein
VLSLIDFVIEGDRIGMLIAKRRKVPEFVRVNQTGKSVIPEMPEPFLPYGHPRSNNVLDFAGHSYSF